MPRHRLSGRAGESGDPHRDRLQRRGWRAPPGGSRAALARQREALSERLFQVVADAAKTTTMLEQGGLEFVLQAEKRPLVDYLALRFQTGDALYEQLYVGEKLKQFHLEPLPDDERPASGSASPTLEQRAFREPRARGAPAADRAALDEVLARMYGTVLAEGRRTARVLLVGDCLHLDVVTFAQPALAAEGITLEPTFATSKNPVQLQREIGALDPARYCAVFFSPFTYEFVPSLEPFQRMGMAARTPWRAGRRPRRRSPRWRRRSGSWPSASSAR